jgi:hypothetical protein
MDSAETTRLEHLARHRAAQRRWREKNLERAREVARRSRLKHLAKRIQATKDWRKEKKKDPEWRKRNCERTKEFTERKLASDPQYREQRMEIKRKSYHKRMQDPKKRLKTAEQSRRSYHKAKADPKKRAVFNARYNRWVKKRIASDSQFLLRLRLRARLSHMIRIGKIKSTESALKLVGCTLEKLREYLERQFTKEMSWLNHGQVWHIDHIVPCKQFNLLLKSHRFLCFNWRNLRPLNGEENLRRQAKLTDTDLALLEREFLSALEKAKVSLVE